MTEAHCVGCGRPLQADDAICPFCAQQLDPDPAPRPKPYRCPACGEWMERPHAAAWPPDAKWYRYTRLRDQCPHCQAWLRDRRDWLATPEAFALWAFSLFSLFVAVPADIRRPITVALLAAWGVRIWRIRQARIPDAERYEVWNKRK